MAKGYWNGLETQVFRGTARVADSGQFPQYWAKEEGLVGTVIPVVKVNLDGVNYGGGIGYLDNRDGTAWEKVTTHGGSPRVGHKNVDIEPGSFHQVEVTGRGN